MYLFRGFSTWALTSGCPPISFSFMYREHRSLTAIGQKNAFSHYWDTRDRAGEKSSGQTHLFKIWTIEVMDRTSGRPQVKLSPLLIWPVEMEMPPFGKNFNIRIAIIMSDWNGIQLSDYSILNFWYSDSYRTDKNLMDWKCIILYIFALKFCSLVILMILYDFFWRIFASLRGCMSASLLLQVSPLLVDVPGLGALLFLVSCWCPSCSDLSSAAGASTVVGVPAVTDFPTFKSVDDVSGGPFIRRCYW